MTLDERIASALRASATLAAITGDRIFPTVPPDNVDAPFIVYQETTAETSPTLDTFGTDFILFDYQFSCWAATPAAAKSIRSALATVIAAGAVPFVQAIAQPIGATVLDPASRLHQAILQVRIPGAL